MTRFRFPDHANGSHPRADYFDDVLLLRITVASAMGQMKGARNVPGRVFDFDFKRLPFVSDRQRPVVLLFAFRKAFATESRPGDGCHFAKDAAWFLRDSRPRRDHQRPAFSLDDVRGYSP